ncbi:immunoglobulin superfamily member 11 [Thalassophryne amazonica]|uniref:immunoglobulin superfamily member 11 n=1 Tax=Thalassophryne amazonica TaxID=390379 RepID=UPI0014711D51|nr:immunoglobulin superfamily member 11 [Thalassophryne amazonica]
MHAWFCFDLQFAHRGERSDFDYFSEMDTSAGWILWTMLSCFTALDCTALRVTVRDSTVEVIRGDSVVLTCSFFTSSPLTRLNIIWTLTPFSSPESPIQVIVYDHGQVIENPSLVGRVAFTGVPWSADIVLNDTCVSDAGVYRCMINNPPETADPGIGELVLSVLAPPSLPVCQWDRDIDLGGSVTLTCTVADGAPTPQIRWHKLNPDKLALPVNMEGDLTGSVHIVNASSQTSGLYQCSASNFLGTQNCYVNLSIYNTPDSSSGLLQGVLLTLSMTLMMLVLLVVILWLHRTRLEVKDDQCYNEIRYTTSLKRSFV